MILLLLLYLHYYYYYYYFCYQINQLISKQCCNACLDILRPNTMISIFLLLVLITTIDMNTILVLLIIINIAGMNISLLS